MKHNDSLFWNGVVHFPEIENNRTIQYSRKKSLIPRPPPTAIFSVKGGFIDLFIEDNRNLSHIKLPSRILKPNRCPDSCASNYRFINFIKFT